MEKNKKEIIIRKYGAVATLDKLKYFQYDFIYANWWNNFIEAERKEGKDENNNS